MDTSSAMKPPGNFPIPADESERIEALYDDAASRASSILSTRAKGGHKSRTTGAWTVVQWGH